MKPKIILLSGKGKFAQFIYNGINRNYEINKVIIEQNEDYKALMKKRMRRIGRIKVMGQIMFSKFIVPKLIKKSGARAKAIIREHKLEPAKIPDDKIINVTSVNDQATIDLIGNIKPDIIIVNSTRIINKAFLNSVKVPIINIHSGVTPKYQGYAGAYWALVKKDKENCGSTIHFLDGGIDTGAILYQGKINVTDNDNYITYNFLNLALEIELLKNALADIVNKNVNKITRQEKYKRWYEPTIWEYWINRYYKKVK